MLAIQGLGSISKDKVIVDSLISKLTTFELNSFDNSVTKSTESALKAYVTGSSARKGKDIYQNHECKTSHGSNRVDEDSEDQVMELEALLAKRFPRGTSKYRGELPLKCFSCNKIGHIAANYPNTNKKEKFRRLKGKGLKHCYVAIYESVTDEESEEEDDNEEIVFVTLKEELSDKKALVSHMENSDEWIMDSGFSHHMTRDKSMFITLNEFDRGIVRFRNKFSCMVKGKGYISLNGKSNADDIFGVDGPKHNLVSVGQLNDKGYFLEFKSGVCTILGGNGELIAIEKQTRGNLFYLNSNVNNCLVARMDDRWLWHKICCHVNFDNLIKIIKSSVVRGLPQLVKLDSVICKDCKIGKMTSISFKRKNGLLENVLDLVHTNLCGPMRTMSYYGDRYFMILKWVTFFTEKSEAFNKFKSFKALFEKETSKNLKV